MEPIGIMRSLRQSFALTTFEFAGAWNSQIPNHLNYLPLEILRVLSLVRLFVCWFVLQVSFSWLNCSNFQKH